VNKKPDIWKWIILDPARLVEDTAEVDFAYKYDAWRLLPWNLDAPSSQLLRPWYLDNGYLPEGIKYAK
jgi:hypothetical protein